MPAFFKILITGPGLLPAIWTTFTPYSMIIGVNEP
jgi:hypothetical protein